MGKAGRIAVAVSLASLLGGAVAFVVAVLYYTGPELWQMGDPFGRGMFSGFVIGLLTPWLIRRLRGR